ncbi:rRNA methyltransferase 3, mitochondrial isoform X1 [Cimex lectularius]|uniref:RNA 2-O ribose methyltransferase substrate binding domain-containing protein n=2 Tax=Cimex lectularius TaxID=79782 RepID=A0A8I6R7B1_CIMLE|nr:rRNA methyltransferase 3, mitochondrial isoform X1 [Cimex lectularius]
MALRFSVFCRFIAAAVRQPSFTRFSFSAAEARPLDSCSTSQKKPTVVRLDYKDNTLSEIMQKVKSKNQRKKSGLILIEGFRQLKEVMQLQEKPLMVFFSQTKDIQDIQFDASTKLYKMPYNELKVWSDVTTSQGIIAICKRPKIVPQSERSLPVTLVCDNVRDPGNLGAIFRVAAGAGVKNIQLTSGCVDPWDMKVLRAGAGAQFKIPIHTDIAWNSVHEEVAQNGSLVFLATNHPTSSAHPLQRVKIPINPYYKVDYTYSNAVVILGGETEGLSNEAYQLANQHNGMRITIPLHNQMESLNTATAASVILFEIKKQYNLLSE